MYYFIKLDVKCKAIDSFETIFNKKNYCNEYLCALLLLQSLLNPHNAVLDDIDNFEPWDAMENMTVFMTRMYPVF